MNIKVTVIKKEEGKGEVPFPKYAVVEISGDEAIVRDLFEKIQQEQETYRLE